MRKKSFVIWGTGDRSKQFSSEIMDAPVFYLDNDKANCGKTFLGKRVLHPTELKNLRQFYIIVASSAYDEIKKQLIQINLTEDKDFCHYQKLVDNNKRIKKLISDVKDSIVFFKNNYEKYKGVSLVFGSMVSFDVNCCKIYNEIHQKIQNKFLMISETNATEIRSKQGLIQFPYFQLPLFLWQNFHLKESYFGEIKVDEDIKTYVREKEYRVLARDGFNGKNFEIANNYADYFVYYADKYLRSLMDYIRPKKVYLWNKFYPFHQLLIQVCKDFHIDIIYMEYGLIPGTYILERTGQMGESYPARYWNNFEKLEITERDVKKATTICEYLFKSGINRKPQPQNSELDNAKRKLIKGYPIVVYAGQNDYESGMYPYTEETKKFHSPIFKSSNEAAYFLAELAKKNHWNFIYKPHPICVDGRLDEVKKNLPEESILISNCNINDLVDLADVNITILSTTAYVSLVREKPTVLLGYTQLYNKNCTYECFEKSKIEEVVKQAIACGYTEQQKKSFLRHVARITKYYLYDDDSDRPIRYGMNWRDFLKRDISIEKEKFMDLNELKRIIASEEHKVISFDIFDTLVVRPCLNPTDILKLVGKRCGYDGNFLEMRRAAEQQARRLAGGKEIKFCDIYRCFEEMFDFSKEEVEMFQKEELRIEKQYIYARQAMKDIYDFAIQTGKKIILVSDMYLSLKVIEEILEKNEYRGYSKIYLSSECGKTKSSGELFEQLLVDLAQENIHPCEVLHMGDNEKSDVLVPEKRNICTVHIPRTHWLLRKNQKLKKLYDCVERKLDNTFLLGYASNRVFNDPFRKYAPNTYFYGSKYNISNMMFAPFFLSFVKWMLEDSIQEGIDTLCMVYRDGYLPEKIYHTIGEYYGKDIPETRRLYLTRAMINKFYSSERNGLFESINDMLCSDNMTIHDFIKNRLYVSNDKYTEVLSVFMRHGYKDETDKIGRRDVLASWINELTEIFVENARKSVPNIREYCRHVLKNAGKVAVYDVGYRGSVCRFLRKQLQIETSGYHLFAKEGYRYGWEKNSCLKYAIMYGLITEKDSMLVNCLTEDLLNSSEPSVIDVNKRDDGAYEFIRDDNWTTNEPIQLLQEYIIQYAEGFADLFKSDMRFLEFDIHHYFEVYLDFLKNSTENDTRIFQDIVYKESSFMNPHAQNVYREWMLKHRFQDKKKRIHYEMEESIKEISDNLSYRLKPTIIFVGNPIHIREDELRKISLQKRNDSKCSYRLVMETSEHTKNEYENLWNIQSDIISRIDLERGYEKNVNMDITAEMKALFNKYKYLNSAVEQVKKNFKDLGTGYAESLVWYWHQFFSKIASIYHQSSAHMGFYVYDRNSIIHQILEQICNEKNIEIVYDRKKFQYDITKISQKILKKSCKKRKEIDKKMKIAIYASMPQKSYSGGRTHALNIAECLSYEGNEVYFISRYLPVFIDEMKDNPFHANIKFVNLDALKKDDFFQSTFDENYLDYFILVPHGQKTDEYYMTGRHMAKRLNAKLILLSYETPNWKNAILKKREDESPWMLWKGIFYDGCMALCSDKEAIKYAREYYVENQAHTKFDFWYPVINSLVAEKVHIKKEKQIIAFINPESPHKGTKDLLKMMDKKLRPYKIVLIYGSGIRGKEYYEFLREIESIKNRLGLQIEIFVQPTDYEKFVEIGKSQIMLFPSYFEGYGTPPIEAQYMNTCCFVYELPVFRETCGDGVVYCEYGNSDDMKRKLLKMLEDGVVEENLRNNVYDIANFEKCSRSLDEMLRSHLDDEWRVGD